MTKIRFRMPTIYRYTNFGLTGPNQSGGTYHADADGIITVDPNEFWDGNRWVRRSDTHQDALKFFSFGGEVVDDDGATKPAAVSPVGEIIPAAPAPAAPAPAAQAELADQLIATEVAKQDGMWGEGNERADASKGQIMRAATAQCAGVFFADKFTKMWPALDAAKTRAVAFREAEKSFYPTEDGWSGFRDYGSDVANLVVAAAYLRNEIKRRIRNGESTYRAPRNPETQPYNPETTPRKVD